MLSPDEDFAAPGSWRRAAKRADYFFSMVQLIASFRKREFAADAPTVQKWHIAEGELAKRLAAADAIIRQIGATAEWRNGYYMARLGGTLEIHFDPPIFQADPGADRGDG